MTESEKDRLVSKTLYLFRDWSRRGKMVQPYRYAEGRKYILWLTGYQAHCAPYHEKLLPILERINGEHGYTYYRALTAKRVGNDER